MLSNETLLLKIIDVNGSISMLLDRGLTYSQIANILRDSIMSGYVISEKNETKLTGLGKKVLSEEFKENKYKAKDSWILPQEKYYCEQLPFNVFVELPKIRDLK